MFLKRKSYEFGTTWGGVNDDRIFIFRWTMPLIFYSDPFNLLFCCFQWCLLGSVQTERKQKILQLPKWKWHRENVSNTTANRERCSSIRWSRNQKPSTRHHAETGWHMDKNRWFNEQNERSDKQMKEHVKSRVKTHGKTNPMGKKWTYSG